MVLLIFIGLAEATAFPLEGLHRLVVPLGVLVLGAMGLCDPLHVLRRRPRQFRVYCNLPEEPQDVYYPQVNLIPSTYFDDVPVNRFLTLLSHLYSLRLWHSDRNVCV